MTPRYKSSVRLIGLFAAALATLAGLASTLGSCALATPFSGPGRSSDGDRVFVAVTNAVLHPDKRRAFDDHTRRVIESLPSHEGYLGHSVRGRVLGNEVWTMTMWRDEESLDAFIESPVHRTAIREGLSGVRTAKFLRFEWSDETPPGWAEILRRLEGVEPIDYSARSRPRTGESS
ncbi:MAG TPA: antibiotic biosynthesis monooxygenase family protein [Phycisphaerales bacterium]